MDPRVSVIIVNYNGGAYLQDCIRALQSQTISEYEVIVVDNNSQDGSLGLVPDDDPRFRVLALEWNSGFAYANNRGVELAQAPWVVMLNGDAFAATDWLKCLLEASESKSEYAFFGSHQLLVQPKDCLDGTGDMLALSGRAWRRDHQSPLELGVGISDEVFGACAAAAMYEKDAFLEVGGFEEDFFCYFEDVDLAFKLRIAGYRCLHVADAIVYHVGSASTSPTSDFQVYHGYRNLVWAYFKNMPLDLLVLNLPKHVRFGIRSVRDWTQKGKGTVIRKAYWDAIRGLPRIIWKRRSGLQRLRRVSSVAMTRHMFLE